MLGNRCVKKRDSESKARFLHAFLVGGGKDLSEEELISMLTNGGIRAPDEIEIRKALYEMLSDGTLVVSDDKKYRLRTTP